MKTRTHPLWKWAFGIYCAAMLWLLFARDVTPVPGDYWSQLPEHLSLVPFQTIRLFLRALDMESYRMLAVVNLLGNIGMFVPLGFFLPLVFPKLGKWWRTWLATLGIMIGVELLQLLTLRGICDVDDLILNLTGGAIGYCLFAVYRLLKAWHYASP